MSTSGERPISWLVVLLCAAVSAFFVWHSQGPKVALLNLFGESSDGRVVEKHEVYVSGMLESYILIIEFETPDENAHRFRFEAARYPHVMEHDAFEVRYLPGLPRVAWPGVDMRWSLAMLLLAMFPCALTVMITFYAWMERGGAQRAWARRIEESLEHAWQRVTERLV